MHVEEIMRKSIVTVEMDDTLEEIKAIFDNVSFHHLLVTESDKLFGVISDRDLLKNLSPTVGTISETKNDLSILKKKAHQILTRNPITLSPKSNLRDAIEIFNRHNISCIPIVDGTYKPVGMLSWRDILKSL